MLRLARPRIALFENVPAVLVSNGGRFFNGLISDISESGYDAEWEIVSAFDVGAKHLRKRIWLVAYPKGRGHLRRQRRMETAESPLRG
jgi:DNA (cytosine-5)-methyltransferase 1